MSGVFDKTEWGGVISSTLASSLIAIGIALYIRYRAKPKQEIIYDANRQANLDLIFSGLNFLNIEFLTFYESIEQRLGELTKERSKIIPFPISKPLNEWTVDDPDIVDFGEISKMTAIFDEIKPMLTQTLTRIREHHKRFLQDYHIYLNYLHDSFLRDVHSYYITTTHYSELLLNGENHYSIGIKRKEEADKIIAYVKDRTVHKTNSIMDFILNWQGWKPKESKPKTETKTPV